MLIKRFGFLRETFLGVITDTLMKMSAQSLSCSGCTSSHLQGSLFSGALLWSQKPSRAVTRRGRNTCCAQRVAY